MKNIILLSVLFLGACTSVIKDQKSDNEEPAFKVLTMAGEYRPEPTKNLIIKSKEDLIGYWVGWFEPDIPKSKLQEFYSNGEYNLSNKINISIDKIIGDSIYGHSVVANTNQTFAGTIALQTNKYVIDVSEPGNHPYDGVFSFQIMLNDSVVLGYWAANDKNLKINRRKYSLKKEVFAYNASHMLEYGAIDESNTRTLEQDSVSLDDLIAEYGSVAKAVAYYFDDSEIDPDEFDLYVEEMMMQLNSYREQVASTTEKLLEYNASNTILTHTIVENLAKMDIHYMRNSIYARHGYSFKDKNLRNYFDQQDWYIPVHASIQADLTEIEKANIKLLLAYEEHAEEYYDEFGR